MRTALNFLIIALVALVLTAAPGGEVTLNVLLTALTLGFFVGIGLFGYKLYRENRMTVDSMTVSQRLAFYGSLAVAFLAVAAARSFFVYGFPGILAWVAILGVSCLGAFLAYSRSRSLYT